jgi:hypothetical protein
MTDDGASRTRPLPVQIVEAVAAVLNTDTTDLPPMYDYVDLEAVARLVESGDPTGRPVEVLFEYEGVDVRVTTDGVETTSIPQKSGGDD